MNTPTTKREEINETIHGIHVSDPYRWLEDGNNPLVQDWIKKQNEYTFSFLKDASFSTFSEELIKNFKVINFSNPVPVNGNYFYTERQPDEDQEVLYMKKGLSGTPIKLFDPNGKHDGNTMSIDYWDESRTGKYIAYGISQGGDEMATLYIKNTETNEELSEKIIHCRYSSVRWLPDDSAFFYTRNARPGTVPKNEEHLHVKVYLHKLGDDPNNDELIFGADRPKDDMLGISLSPDGTYLGIQASHTWTEDEIYIYNPQTKEIKPLIVGIPSKFSFRLLRDKILINTNYKANNYRVLWSSYDDMYKNIDSWKEFVPEREFPLESIHITKDKILINYLVNACSEVFVFDYEGKNIGKIPLPVYSSLAGISTRRNEEEFFYGVSSFVFPKILYRYNPTTKEYDEYRKTDNPIHPDDFEIKQEWYASKDGTKVPLFIFYRKGLKLDGSNPTILYGYGGFNSNVTPSFMRNWIPWIIRGGIFVIANIRGGGEFGEKWHTYGAKEYKQNSFDDFAFAAQYLITQKYTSTSHLGILGGSNGGLLVSAVSLQHPELFSAVCSKVPLTDMVRFPQFGIAMRWVHEYGNPEIKEELENIMKWSPYHTTKDGVEYPNTLFVTAEKDTRVDPLHSRKMAAMLQYINKTNKIFIFTETDAGHGAGKPIAKMVEDQALTLSFFAQNTGLHI